MSCKSCGAPTRWAKTVNDKPILVDLDPVESGNIVLRWNVIGKFWRALVVSKDFQPGENEPRYVAHFSTCPYASRYRRRRNRNAN